MLHVTPSRRLSKHLVHLPMSPLAKSGLSVSCLCGTNMGILALEWCHCGCERLQRVLGFALSLHLPLGRSVQPGLLVCLPPMVPRWVLLEASGGAAPSVTGLVAFSPPLLLADLMPPLVPAPQDVSLVMGPCVSPALAAGGRSFCRLRGRVAPWPPRWVGLAAAVPAPE